MARRDFNASIYNDNGSLCPTSAGEDGDDAPPAATARARPVVYDTTLRDGEQMPGVRFRPDEKVRIATMLDRVGVPEIEAGFPAVSRGEREAIREVARLGLDARILVLTRLCMEDVELARRCDADCALVFIGSSPTHLRHKLRTDIPSIAERVPPVLERVRDYGMVPSFSTEDSTRTPLSDLRVLHRAALDAGARRIGVTDTVGCASPEAIRGFVTTVKEFTPVPLSVHLHNDFGMATANAVTGATAGAELVATTVNGMGERAGNVPLDEFVMAMEVLYGVDMGMDTSLFFELSRTVAEAAGITLHPTKPLTGSNAFTHESGIHVAAILEDPSTYEAIAPEAVGNHRDLVLGKHSGLSYVTNRLRWEGIEVDALQSRAVLEEVKRVGELKGRVDDETFRDIVHSVLASYGRAGCRVGGVHGSGTGAADAYGAGVEVGDDGGGRRGKGPGHGGTRPA